MKHALTFKELRKVTALRDLPDEHLKWIMDHSEYAEYDDGHIISQTGESINYMAMLLEGKVDFYMNVNGRLVFYFRFENNDMTGGVTGLLPYSRMQKTPGNSYASGRTRVLKLNKKFFPDLERLNPDLIQRLIGYMTERARSFATTQMQQEKVSALGKLAAGIAHEMNNPAAAIDRISDELDKKWKLNIELTEELLRHNITPELIQDIRRIAQVKKNNHPSKNRITPLQRMEMEDDLNNWLDEKGFKGLNDIAHTLTEAGFSRNDLEMLVKESDDRKFKSILDWLENLLSADLLIKDLEDASERIVTLVSAIKSHVHMDRSGSLHYTDIHKDIEDTLILLGYKIRDKHITIKKKFCNDMPEVEAYSGELNQVWTNIIDNAVYAVPQDGEIVIETLCDNNYVTVTITDNGAGIPKEIQSRIFDPFFTTKKVGEGTGIGLDIVRSVIDRHHGEIKVNSGKGKTEFVIRFPVIQRELKEENNE